MDTGYIVDSHVHLWDTTRFRYPWLADLPALNHPFLSPDFVAASAASNIGKWIFVECGAVPSLGEVDWISDLAKSEKRIRGIVAYVSLEKGEAVRADLEELSARPLVKGIRRNVQGETPAFCLSPEFLTGVKLLKDFGFTFDLCIRHQQLPAVIELVRRVPEVNFILDHFGKPAVRGTKTEPWATHLQELAKSPNVVCKVSGLTTEADWKNWQPADLKVYFEQALECFGFDRLLFGGDWPVSTLATSYERWMDTVQNFLSFAKAADRTKVFKSNAERIYRV
ncbi:MAG TPA: amidohydrolase family protein [Verrucomicrobiae bacterium]|jgi:L-fuconolactonase